MPDIIHLLPDAVANQIAAGEVVQRPSSVVKELTENAVDAGAGSITINVKDAGKTLIQVIDNGCGMSSTDARMAFERHATSKISHAQDLYAIRTMGFRGEALASIAAVSHVELKTRLHDSELGSNLVVSASQVLNHDPCQCNPGSNISVKNLFFNVPARRKFLKSNSTELSHIIDEVQRLALANPEIAIEFIHNDIQLFQLPPSNIKQRIVNLLGKSLNQSLVPVSVKTSIAEIKGYIGKPETAKKTHGEQFFFVNNRFMRHPYFFKAVLKAYDNLIPADTLPAFFIYFIVDPSEIDVNIHPTKTEIKFENELPLWQILLAMVKEGIGKYNFLPSIDFNVEPSVVFTNKNQTLISPEIKTTPGYNPFVTGATHIRQDIPADFGNDIPAYHAAAKTSDNDTYQQSQTGSQALQFQFKNKYIVTQVRSGLMFIDQKRAHERILYEELKQQVKNHTVISQKCLYPARIELSPADATWLTGNMDLLTQTGFDLGHLGNNTFTVNGMPPFIEQNISDVLPVIIQQMKENQHTGIDDPYDKTLIAITKASAIDYGRSLKLDEMRNLIDRLFACTTPAFTPDGKTIITIIENDDIEKRFKT